MLSQTNLLMRANYFNNKYNNMKEPFYWLNEESVQFLNRGYLEEGVQPKERIKQIADRAEELNKVEGFSDKFYDYMSRGWISLSTPIWCNYGLERGLPISCFGASLEDDTADILRGSSEIGMLTKHGGGTAAYFGKLRSRGTEISGGGKSNGSIAFMNIFDTMMSIITQGESRRGAFAAYLPIDHGDIMEFLTIREDDSSIQNISIGVTVPEGWMQSMIDGDTDKRKVWARVLRKRSESGYPYILFEDNVNNNSPQAYKDKGLKIKTSQLCVSGDQLVPTQHGIKTAKELYQIGGELKLTDGFKVINSSEMKLIEKIAPTYRITLDNGMTHTVTPEHKLKVYDTRKNKKYRVEELKDLVIGDKLLVQTKEGIFGDKNNVDEAYLLGLYQGDGTQTDYSCRLDVWENDFDLIGDIEERYDNLLKKYEFIPRYSTKGGKFIDSNSGQSDVKKKSLNSEFLKKILKFEKGVVPNWVFESNKESQWAYITGLLQTDGTAFMSTSKGNPIQISYADTNIEHLKELQILMSNLGIKTSIKPLRKGGKVKLPNGKGGSDIYNTKDCYRLIIGNKPDALVIEKNTKFLTRKGVFIEDRKYRDNTKKYGEIVDIEYVGEQPVYCVTVDTDEHFWVCNGVITHNCSEILEYNDDEKTFTCCLSSLNLEHYDDWKDTDLVETVTIFLDTVMEEFIIKAEGIPFLDKTVKFAKEHRSIGLGVLGLHSYLQSKMLPFEGFETKMVLNNIFSNINKKSLKASKQLATELGEPEILKGYGERFTTRMAIAPTTSSSFILGQVSPSIEPLNSNYFIKDVAKGKFAYRNPYLKRVLDKHNKDTPTIWRSILEKGGSVQHLTFLTKEEKEVFKTFGEISQIEIIQNASIIQKYIDQGISLNTMIHPNTPVKDINALIIEAWKLGIKTLYYQRSTNMAQELGRDLLNCVSCEG